VTARIAQKLPEGKAIGIDTSQNMIRFARNAFASPGSSNLMFCVMDATRLGFGQRFDRIFSNAALHWVQDHLSVLRGIARILKRDGRALLQMGGKGNLEDVIQAVLRVAQKDPWRRWLGGFSLPVRFCSPDQYRDWIHHAGLIAERVELVDKDMRQKGKHGLALRLPHKYVVAHSWGNLLEAVYVHHVMESRVSSP